jgi:hypothetical protein
MRSRGWNFWYVGEISLRGNFRTLFGDETRSLSLTAALGTETVGKPLEYGLKLAFKEDSAAISSESLKHGSEQK